MVIDGVDHVVITVSELDAALEFYQEAVGLEVVDRNEEGTLATLRAGSQLVRLQTEGRKSPLMASDPVPGGTDMCFVSPDAPEVTAARFQRAGAPVVAGPVEKHGSRGPMMSVYARDPDGSLIEVAHYA